MQEFSQCPVCLNLDGANFEKIVTQGYDGQCFQCGTCGRFKIDASTLASSTLSESILDRRLRAILSWRIQNQTDTKYPEISSDYVNNIISSKISLPTPSQQTANILRYIGDIVINSGRKLDQIPSNFHSKIGSISKTFALDLTSDLIGSGYLSGHVISIPNMIVGINNLSLTVAGWDRYEAEKRGLFSSKMGFIALKFGDSELDSLLSDHIKPAISDLGYILYDMRDVSRAGLIDDLMRVQIRDSAFVLADLTHDSNGAYWEAGYAEGLGKPVLYICEKSKFEDVETHFDTSHSTTVQWDRMNLDGFRKELTATLRRSLGLFDH